MISETEISKEVSVVGIGEKCGIDSCSHQNLSNPDCKGFSNCNQANNLERSYVSVTGTDELLDDAVGTVCVVTEGSSAALKSTEVATSEDKQPEIIYENGKVDAATENIVKSLDQEGAGSVCNGDSPVEIYHTRKHESSSAGEPRIQSFVTNYVEECNDRSESSVEAEEAKPVEDPAVKNPSMAEVVVEEIGYQKGKIGSLARLEEYHLIKSESDPAPAMNQESQVGALEFASESAEKGDISNISLHINGVVSANVECGDQNTNTSSTEELQENSESQDRTVYVVGCESQNLSLLVKTGVKLAKKVVDAAENEIPSSALELVVEQNLISRKEGMHEEEAKMTLSLDIHEHLQLDTALESNGQHVLAKSDEIETIVSSIDCPVEFISDVILEEKNGESFALHIDNDIQHVDEPDNLPNGRVIPRETVSAESKTRASLLGESFTASCAHSPQTECEKLEGSVLNTISREEMDVTTKTKPFNFLVRVPRFDDDHLKEQISLAKIHVEKKTKIREAIQIQIQEKRVSCQIHGVDYEYARAESRGARKLVKLKRMEIDSLQSTINKAKNALSIEDINAQILKVEHMIQHETLPLKNEIQFIREIKQLKQLREQLSSNLGSQDEIKHALEQREEVEERLKILRKELDALKNQVLKAEASATVAGKRYNEENTKLRELQTEFRAADNVRQSAYAQLLILRKELSKKNKHFLKYKDAAAVANNYAFTGNTEALYLLCTENVKNLLELWNTDDEFREDYVRYNARSTIRRLGTLDGRSLGPNEQLPILPSYADGRIGSKIPAPAKVDVALLLPISEPKQETTVETVVSDGKSMLKVTEHKNQKVSNMETAVPVIENGYHHVSHWVLADELHEEPKKSAAEIELIRREEELRREEAEAKLKEQRRLEALEKANEARERKKRRAEKLQMRAELKTQKEAEEKEKEKERRLRKKERKQAGPNDINDTNHHSEAAPSSEIAPEIIKDSEAKNMPPATSKKPQKGWTFMKQSKSKTIPPPIRNRNRRKLLQQWMWVGFACLLILLLFWMGNVSLFSNSLPKRRSPFL